MEAQLRELKDVEQANDKLRQLGEDCKSISTYVWGRENPTVKPMHKYLDNAIEMYRKGPE